MRHLWENRQWHGSNVNDYQNSLIATWLNNDFINMIEANIRSHVRQVRVPFRPGSGTSLTVNSGAQGLQTRAFLLSAHEVGSGNQSNLPVDGATLELFSGIENTNTQPRRVATLNGSATWWWLRSPNTNSSTNTWNVNTNGNMSWNNTTNSNGIRPALMEQPDRVSRKAESRVPSSKESISCLFSARGFKTNT
jgi:hypothetical protein